MNLKNKSFLIYETQRSFKQARCGLPNLWTRDKVVTFHYSNKHQWRTSKIRPHIDGLNSTVVAIYVLLMQKDKVHSPSPPPY
ncbi:hypothetical protein P8452_64701 [Trifolium repens]|nr:hypothetical protein P8452_64701 [Trifolium repens]